MTDAVTRFSSEGTLLLGAGAAILLQSADPVIGAVVTEHSDFQHDPLKRLNNTLTFVYGTMLGTPTEAALVATYTRRAHERIPGSTDPVRQLWVAATLYGIAVQVHERVRGALDPGDAQKVLEAYAVLGTTLEVPLGAWPATTTDFDTYWSDVVNQLEVTPAARTIAHDLFHPITAPLWMRAILPLASLLTAELLGERLREGFGMPWSRTRARRAARAWAFARFTARVLPDRVLTAPSRHYLRRLRRFSAAHSASGTTSAS